MSWAGTRRRQPSASVLASPSDQVAGLPRFDRPYAMIATATSDRPSVRQGLPVLSAWVREPDR